MSLHRRLKLEAALLLKVLSLDASTVERQGSARAIVVIHGDNKNIVKEFSALAKKVTFGGKKLHITAIKRDSELVTRLGRSSLMWCI